MKLWFALFLLLFFNAWEMFAQSDRATISGTVKDVSGALVAHAQVVVTNVTNNLRSSTITDASGRFTFLNLAIGQYRINCSKDGFAEYRHLGLDLAISQATDINVVLTIGSKSETITVVGDTPQLQTQTSSISTNLGNAEVTELPLNVQGGRNLATFMFDYVPGVEGNGPNPSDKDFASHINGSLSDTKEVMIDGTSAVSQIGGYLSESSPPMEAVQEFQVTSAGINADDGRTGGGVFRYEMKSGTNAWHGSGLYYMHNEAFDARSWGDIYNQALCLDAADGNPSQTASCQRGFGKPADSLYDYGASFGGPIKKDKLFFYAAWERYTFANDGIGALSSTVPTTAFLKGNFSALLDKSVVLGTDSAGRSVYKGAIIDPQTGDAFPGNVIPASRISAVSQRIAGLYERYYQPLAPTLTNNNALPLNSPATWYQSNEYSVKIDYNATEKHRVDGSIIYAYIPRLLSDQGGIWSAGSADGGPMANAYDHNTTAPALRARDSWAVSSALLNVFSATFNRFRNPSEARSREGVWPTMLGLGDFDAGNFPIIKFQGINGTDHTYVDGLPIDETQLGSQFNDFYAANTFIYDDTLSWIRGRHTYKFGAEFRAQQFNSHGDYGVPTFVFDPTQTAGVFGPNAGFGFASFLLGDVNQGLVSEPNSTYGRRKSLSLFAQDNIKVTSRFTLNVDLRWDFNGRYHEKYGHWSNFDTTAINPVTGQPGALGFANNGGDSFETKQYYHNFSGFLGGAYQITPRTVARASFGVFYVPLNLNTYSGIPYGFDPGFVLNNQVQTPFDWDKGYPGKAVNIGKNPNFTEYGMVSIDPRMLELGNVQAWSAGVQREVGRGVMVEANGIQNHGYHLESGFVDANQPVLSTYTALVQSGQQYATVTKPGFTGPGWASVAPFPNVAATFGPLYYVGSPRGNTDYQSLQLSVRKQTARGLSLLASYNWSSSHGDVDTAFEDLYYAGPLQDVYNLQQERHTISDFDQTHIVKGYALYELPFGRGKALLAKGSPAANALVGGWTISGDFHYASGMPIRIAANVFYPGINNVYADMVPGCQIGEHYNGQVGGSYLNPACFVNPPNGEFGNAPGYLAGVRNPGFAVEDLGVSKLQRFGERCQLRLYFQVFNVFNRHGFVGPNTQIGTAGFGQVLPQDLNGLPGPRVGQFGARLSF
ncbi:MAG TPA: carboxypeptidase regulatory-like domain-containing protein [Candidatus Eremiobacteraceae bacterium]|nr:carboxypeptidase regulatory-like domain-containing protein [Candidatus Eremiobacteraceae bacterium]